MLESLYVLVNLHNNLTCMYLYGKLRCIESFPKITFLGHTFSTHVLLLPYNKMI